MTILYRNGYKSQRCNKWSMRIFDIFNQEYIVGNKMFLETQ